MKITQLLSYDGRHSVRREGNTFGVQMSFSKDRLSMEMERQVNNMVRRFKEPWLIITRKDGTDTSVTFTREVDLDLKDAVKVYLSSPGSSEFIEWSLKDVDLLVDALYLVQAVYMQDEYLSFPDGDPASPAMYPDAWFFDEKAAKDYCEAKNESLSEEDRESHHFEVYVLKA